MDDNSALIIEDLEKSIEDLEGAAAVVLRLKKTSIPRRPIVIEFCGSPKAGKTSCISALAMFLRRNGFRVKVLVERASVCPVANKYDPFFNIWTICSALSELTEVISNSPKDYDVIILDRGIFDALCWFEWQVMRNYLDSEALIQISNFLLMKKWQSAIDLVLVFKADSGVSIAREYAALLTRKRGSIMKESILESYRRSIELVEEKYGKKFKKVSSVDTSNIDQNSVSYRVTNLILEILQDVVSERIGFVRMEKFRSGSFNGSKAFNVSILPPGGCMEFAARPRVENDGQLVQPIPILIITEPGRKRVLTAKKNKRAAKESSPESGKTLLYFGGHTREEDCFIAGRNDIMSVCRSALTRELKEEIGVDFCADNFEPTMLIWDHDNERSRKHMAICFVWETDLDSINIKLDRNEFSISADANQKFSYVDELRAENLEAWSQAILINEFNTHSIQQPLPFVASPHGS